MQKITRKRLKIFLEKHATDQLVLDVGAGHVSSNHSYTAYFPNRHTVDIDPTREPDTVGDVHELPFQDESYQFVVCTEVLEHCHAPQKAIDEMYRVLKPGGTLVLTTRFVYPLHDVPDDYFRFTKYGLAHLLQAWSDVSIEPETETFSSLGALFQRVGFQAHLKGGRVTKLFMYGFAWALDKFNWLVMQEFGNIQKTENEEQIMTTGYYVVANK